MKHVASKMYDNLAKGRECFCGKVNQAMIQKYVLFVITISGMSAYEKFRKVDILGWWNFKGP